MPVDAEPEVQAQWWNSLPESERDRYRRAAPVELYDMPGLPKREKDELAGPGPYNRIEALRYARDHALATTDPRAGNDCTNFISRAMKAGGRPEDDNWHAKNDPGWFGLDGDDAYGNFVRASDNKNYLLSHGGQQVDRGSVQPGDIVYFTDDTGFAHHAAMVTSVLPNGDVLYSQHTDDARNYSLDGRQPQNAAVDGGEHENLVFVRP